ncbi:hypothetical protein JD969_12885 [Planctomycetota bacterium]|nr:hypothetical protein JD969_12885 [Planctomycetota bacterium]
MFTRQHLSVFVVCTGLITGSALLLNAAEEPAATAPTAAELYVRGMDKFDSGELQAAKEIFHQIDPMQLPKDQRVRLYESLKSLDDVKAEAEHADKAEAVEAEHSEEVVEATKIVPAEEVKAPSAADMLAEADSLVDTTKAAALYEQILASEGADASLKARAKARLAQIKRQLKSDLNTALTALAMAEEDLKAGRLDEAAARLEMIKEGGVELGWFDNGRMSSLAKTVSERQNALAAAEAAQKLAEAEAVEAAKVAEAAEVTKAADALAKADADKAAAEEETKKALEDLNAEMAEKLAAAEAKTDVEVKKAVAAAEAKKAEEIAAAVAAAKAEDVEKAAAEEAAATAKSADLMEAARLAAAKRNFIKAQEAKANGQNDLAEALLNNAIQLDPENEAYKTQLSALSATSAVKAPTSVLADVAQQNALKEAKAKADYKRYMNDANAGRVQKDFPAARNAVANAKNALANARLVLSEVEYKQLKTDAETLASVIEKEYLQFAKLEIEREKVRQQEDQIKNVEATDRATRVKVESLIRRAFALRDEQKYEEALELLDNALFLDPQNFVAKGYRDMIQDVLFMVEAKKVNRLRDVALAESALMNAQRTIPINELITYPADWPQLSEIRFKGLEEKSGEAELNNRVTRKLAEPIPVEFDNWQLVNALNFIRKTTGVNLFVNWPALENAGIDRDTLVDLQLSNIPAEQALKLVLQQVSAEVEFDPLGYSINNGILTVSTERDLQKETDIRTYDIRDLLVQVPNFSNAPSFDLNDALSNTSSGGSGGGSSNSLFGDDSSDDENANALDRDATIEMITQLIIDTVGSFEEWDINGGDVSSLKELNGQLIVKSTPRNHKQILGLLSQLRETRAVQINVESRFLVVDQNFLEEVGVDLDLRLNNLGGGFGPIGVSQDSSSLASGASTTLTPFDRSGAEDFSWLETDDFKPGTGFGNTLRSMDFGISYIDDLEVNLLVSATQANQRSISLTAPRLTFFNGQRAWVTVARQISFVSDLEPVSDAAGWDITVSVLTSGTLLDVRGTVSSDRRYVTLTVLPSLSRTNADFDRYQIIGTTEIDNGGDDENDQTIVLQGFIEVPEVEITQVQATVSVPDRGTILLGGQRLVEEVEVEAGVPVLSKIPFLNRLFTNTSMAKDERTLLILIKPTIIILSEEEEKNFPGMTQSAESFNLGATMLAQ